MLSKKTTDVKRSPKKTTEAGKVLIVPVETVRLFPNQPRKYFSTESLGRLADNIRGHGQLAPALVKRVNDDSEYDYELIDGQRRLTAIQIAGLPKMKVIVVNKEISQKEQFEMSVISNFGSEGHTPIEIAEIIKRFRNEGRSFEQIATIFVKSLPWTIQHLKIINLIPAVLDMMSLDLPKDKRLTYSLAVELADLPKEHQLSFAEIIIKKGLKLGSARDFIRKEVERKGIKSREEKRKRAPDDDYRLLRSFVKRTLTDSGLLGENSQEFFNTLLQGRSSEEGPIYIMGDILAAIEHLRSIRQKIKMALDARRASRKPTLDD